jgi:hypothetical protein
MVVCKTKRWGNSIGIVIPKEEVDRLGLGEEQTITVNIVKHENPLRELWEWGKTNKHKRITREEFLTYRKELESKWMR